MLGAWGLEQLLSCAVRGRTHIRARAVFERALRLEQVYLFRDDRRRQLLQWRDVDDPESTTVRRRDELAVARMDLQVIDRHRRQAGHELVPGPAAVERDVNAARGADVEQIAVVRVLAERAHIVDAALWKIVDDGRERPAAV